MINSKKAYKQFLKSDKEALGINNNNILLNIKDFFFPNYIWKFQKLLRKLEYFHNCKNKGLNKFYYYYLKFRFRVLSVKLGFSIPINVFGPGLSIVHYGTIIVNRNTKVGKNCRIHACTNIGASGGNLEAPQIGDNVYIAPGAKIYGDIKIANNIAIGANSVVYKSFNKNGTMIAGNPAKEIKKINIKKIIKHLN